MISLKIVEIEWTSDGDCNNLVLFLSFGACMKCQKEDVFPSPSHS